MNMQLAKPENQRIITLVLLATTVLFFILFLLFVILFATKHCKKCEPAVGQDNTNSYLAEISTSMLQNNDAVQTLTDIFTNAGYVVIHVSNLKTNNQNYAMGIVTAKTTDSADTVMERIRNITKILDGVAVYDGNNPEPPVCPKAITPYTTPYTGTGTTPTGAGTTPTGTSTTPATSNSTSCPACPCTTTPFTTAAQTSGSTQPPGTGTTQSTTTGTGPTKTTTTEAPYIPNNQSCVGVVKDFVFIIDLLEPLENNVDKFGSLQTFFTNISQEINFGDTKSRAAVLGYDSEHVIGQFYFANSLSVFTQIFTDVLSYQYSAINDNNEADFEMALGAVNNYQFRANVEKHVLVIADHPARSVEEFSGNIKHLKYDKYYLTGITPTSQKSVQNQVHYLFVTDEQAYDGTITSYSNFLPESIAFFLKTGCGYTYVDPNYVPPQPTYIPPTKNPVTTTALTTVSSVAPQTTTIPQVLDNSCQDVDIIFILDRSQSIDPLVYNGAVKEFIRNITSKFTFMDAAHNRPNYARVGVIQFNDVADVTIHLDQDDSYAEFVADVNANVIYQEGGNTKIFVGLDATYNEFQRVTRNTHKVAILMTDGVDSFENDLNDNQTLQSAEKLRTIVNVFMGIGIGEQGSMNMENLTSLIGNSSYAYDTISDAYNATYGVDAEIAKAYKCPKISCKGVIFVEEMTEIVGQTNKIIFLETTLKISQTLYNLDNTTLFALWLFHNDTIIEDPVDYTTFTAYVTEKLNLERYNNTPQQGLTYTKMIFGKLLDYLTTHTYLRKNFIVFMGQTYKIDDSYLDAKALAQQLALIADFYVVDTTYYRYTQEDVLYDLINSNFNRYVNDTGRFLNNGLSSTEIAAQLNTSLTIDVSNYNCTAPPLPPIIPCNNFMDVAFALYQTSSNETIQQLIDIAKYINLGYTGQDYYSKKTIIRYGYDVPLQALTDLTYDDSLIESLIETTSFGDQDDFSYESPIYLSQTLFTGPNARSYAPKTIIYVMDYYPVNDFLCATATNTLNGLTNYEAYPYIFAITTAQKPVGELDCGIFQKILSVNFTDVELANINQYNQIVSVICPIPFWMPCYCDNPAAEQPTCKIKYTTLQPFVTYTTPAATTAVTTASTASTPKSTSATNIQIGCNAYIALAIDNSNTIDGATFTALKNYLTDFENGLLSLYDSTLPTSWYMEGSLQNSFENYRNSSIENFEVYLNTKLAQSGNPPNWAETFQLLASDATNAGLYTQANALITIIVINSPPPDNLAVNIQTIISGHKPNAVLGLLLNNVDISPSFGGYGMGDVIVDSFANHTDLTKQIKTTLKEMNVMCT